MGYRHEYGTSVRDDIILAEGLELKQNIDGDR